MSLQTHHWAQNCYIYFDRSTQTFLVRFYYIPTKELNQALPLHHWIVKYLFGIIVNILYLHQPFMYQLEWINMNLSFFSTFHQATKKFNATGKSKELPFAAFCSFFSCSLTVSCNLRVRQWKSGGRQWKSSRAGQQNFFFIFQSDFNKYTNIAQKCNITSCCIVAWWNSLRSA